MPFQSHAWVFHNRVLGSLGRRYLMTSTQEPNTMAPQSTLCICLRKRNTKLIVPMYFGTKTSKFCLRIISFLSLESELSFNSEDSEINFEHVRQLWTHCLELWEQFTTFQVTKGKTSLRTSCLYIRNGMLDTKWRSRQMKSRKENSRTTLDGNFVN